MPATVSASAVVVSTDGSDFDTTLSVYEGYAESSYSLGESDNDAAGVTSSVTIPVIAGETYLIAVDGVSGAQGNIVLSITQTPPPANDNLANAQHLTGLPVGVRSSNLGATAETNEPNHYGYSPSNSIWYAWTAPSSGNGWPVFLSNRMKLSLIP